MPRLKIPANGASGRSLKSDDSQIGIAHPNNNEKWLKNDKKEKKGETNRTINGNYVVHNDV